MAMTTRAAAQQETRQQALFLAPELLGETVDRARLFLPLTFTYLLSMHVPFCVPVREENIAVVESIFDQVLNGHSLESKGIAYVSIGANESIAALLKDAALVITTDAAATSQPELQNVPQALICNDGKTQQVRLRNTENIADEALKAKLVGCAQLINIQSGGFITEGHFSLSW